MFNSFQPEIDFVNGTYVTVAVCDGLAFLPRDDFAKMSADEQNQLIGYTRHHCRRAGIPLLDILFDETEADAGILAQLRRDYFPKNDEDAERFE